MKNLIKLLVFLIYTVIIFLTSNYYILEAYLIINTLLMLILKVKIKNATRNLWNLLPFIIFTSVINIWLADIKYAVLIAIKLLIVCNTTYIFTRVLNSTELANAVEKLFYPLRILKINPKDISLIICICIAFIPILSRELRTN